MYTCAVASHAKYYKVDVNKPMLPRRITTAKTKAMHNLAICEYVLTTKATSFIFILRNADTFVLSINLSNMANCFCLIST